MTTSDKTKEMMEYPAAVAAALHMGLSIEGLYWCDCCDHWAHHDGPCDCAYGLCEGKCRKEATTLDLTHKPEES